MSLEKLENKNTLEVRGYDRRLTVLQDGAVVNSQLQLRSLLLYGIIFYPFLSILP